jgi:hypothetical protein
VTKSGYTDHGLVGTIDDTFAFAPGLIASGSSGGPPRPILDLEVTREPHESSTIEANRVRAIPATIHLPVGPSVPEPLVSPAPVVDENRQTQKIPSHSSSARTIEATPPAKAIQIKANKTEPVAKVLQPTVRKRLFSTAASKTPPSAAPAEKVVQVPSIARTTSDQASAPAAATPFASAAPVTSQTAPIPTPEPAAAMEIIPPKMLELTDRVLLESPWPPDAPRPVSRSRQLKTAAELAAILERDLTQHPNSPKQGLRVTAYGGGADWRAMLTILPAAGGVRNAPELRALTDHLAEGLRQRYNLAWG